MMATTTDREKTEIGATVGAIHKAVLPYLSDPCKGAHVKAIIEDELQVHDTRATSVRSDAWIFAAVCAFGCIVLITVVAWLAS